MAWWKRPARVASVLRRGSPVERRLFAEAVLRLSASALVVRSPWRARLLVAAENSRKSGRSAADLEHAVHQAAAVHPWPMACLERALALRTMVERRGGGARLRIGVRPGATGLEAHAWVEAEGVAPDPFEDEFAVLEALPPAPAPSYAVAGVRVTSTHPAPDLESRGSTDLELHVSFDDPPGDWTAESEDWHALADDRMPTAWCRADGRAAYIGPGGADETALQIRRVVPFAAALQGHVVLHAAAVRLEDRAAAIVGESGAGKSTLAEAFADAGVDVLADDLLPCRLVGDTVLVPDAETGVPLRVIAWLKRDPQRLRVRWSALTKASALRALMHHGFGEIVAPQVWALQFGVYDHLVRQSATGTLELPGDLALLDDAVAGILTDLLPALLTLHDPGEGA